MERRGPRTTLDIPPFGLRALAPNDRSRGRRRRRSNHGPVGAVDLHLAEPVEHRHDRGAVVVLAERPDAGTREKAVFNASDSNPVAEVPVDEDGRLRDGDGNLS